MPHQSHLGSACRQILQRTPFGRASLHSYCHCRARRSDAVNTPTALLGRALIRPRNVCLERRSRVFSKARLQAVALPRAVCLAVCAAVEEAQRARACVAVHALHPPGPGEPGLARRGECAAYRGRSRGRPASPPRRPSERADFPALPCHCLDRPPLASRASGSRSPQPLAASGSRSHATGSYPCPAGLAAAVCSLTGLEIQTRTPGRNTSVGIDSGAESWSGFQFELHALRCGWLQWRFVNEPR